MELLHRSRSLKLNRRFASKQRSSSKGSMKTSRRGTICITAATAQASSIFYGTANGVNDEVTKFIQTTTVR